MKKSMKIAVAALVAFAILGTWAVGFAIAESDRSGPGEASSAAAQAQTLSSGTVLSSGTAAVTAGTPLYEKSELFSDRDLKQEADLTDAVTYTVSDGQDITITQAGVYVLTGSAREVTVTVDADKEAKVQLVLDGLSVANEDAPVIYAKTADKLFVTIAGDSDLSVTGSFRADGDVKLDGVIFSRCDLTLNGTGVLTLTSVKNGVVGKDDLKITGGTYVISAKSKALEANDSIRIRDGVLELVAGTDALHAENDSDDSKGYIYIGGGTLSVHAGDDAIHAATVVQVDEGDLTLVAPEGIEGTYIQLNGGSIDITSTDDGINAAQKSSAYRPTVEINGGNITVSMGPGDTDGVDSNGDIIINGGTVSVTGSSTFDCDGSAQLNGGTVIVNGQQVDTLPIQRMGGRGGMGGFGGRRGW